MERRVHIMIVDDEEIVRDSLTGWLQEDGYEVEAAESGMKALELLPSKEWNLAMVDLKMPGMDGIELMDEIKKSRPDTWTPR
jgi:CheY-like chemotaxis protein